MPYVNIKLEPHTEAIIRQVTDSLGISIDEFLINSAYEKAVALLPISQSDLALSAPIHIYFSPDILLADFVQSLSEASFDDDVVSLQRAMRDEWE
jgi:hypothetical protein